MCCRLRLDKRELLRRNGGLFGSGDSTGSIGVVTLNLPRYAYLSKDKDELIGMIEEFMVMAKDSLEIKRKYLQEEILDKGLLPAYDTYIGTLNNHFSTIGYVGENEMCVNLLGKNIESAEGKDLAHEVLEFMRSKLVEFQEETGNLYNLEATPAESTCYRLASLDKEMFPDIFTQGPDDAPYYTNSCHLPVKNLRNIKQITDHQNDLQILHTGGTVIHYYLDGPISGEQAKHIVKTVCSNYGVPYISLSPVNCYCPNHGHLNATYRVCPQCGAETDLKQRITGYLRSVKYFNPGKKSEFFDRAQLVINDNNI
jgi:ribonucleoside-triphosphate reductase